MRLFLYLPILVVLFGQRPTAGSSSQRDPPNEGLAQAGEGKHEIHASVGEIEWDQNYVFKPPPVFWMPLSALPSASFPPYDLGHHPHPPHRVIFASCNRQPEGKFESGCTRARRGLDPQRDLEGRRVWRHISQRKPRAFLWMGDNVYADHMQLPTASDSRNFLWKITEGKKPIPPPGLLAAYRSQLATKEYTDFLAEVPGIAGTWDDHDMGEDNANNMYAYKEESKQAMLDFLGVDESAAIRSMDWRGVYSSHDLRFGEALRVKVIFLDLRFERDSWWLMDDGDMLGEQQWTWLQHELQLSTADVNVVVSSLQAFANHRQAQTWSHFPWARERLFALLAGSGVKTPILLSGDTHYAEFAAIHCQRLPEAWCLDEPQARGRSVAPEGRAEGSATPHQQLRKLANSDDDDSLMQHQQQKALGNLSGACDPSEQCCSAPSVRSVLLGWIPRHLPFFLLALFRVSTKPDVFVPRQRWRLPVSPAFSGAFPPPPFPPYSAHQDAPLMEDTSSTYLFDFTSSGLGHGVPESMCRAVSAVVELAIYFLTEGGPFASTLNADLTGPRLLYPERNFGELEFIENPLQLLLFPHVSTRSVQEETDIVKRLPKGDAVSREQILRVREKIVALEQLHRKLDSKEPLQVGLQLTRKITAGFRKRLVTFKKQRQELVEQLRPSSGQQVAVSQTLKALSASFGAYVHAMLGVEHHLFERLLRLHFSLLSIHACEDEGAQAQGGNGTRRRSVLFGSCSLLAPWGSIYPRRGPRSFSDRVLWWLGDLVLGLNAHREARSSFLPIADVATLRLSASVDELLRGSAASRVEFLADAVSASQHAHLLAGSRWRGAKSLRWVRRQPSKVSQPRAALRKLFAATSDGLLREACLQLRSTRRRYQRSEMQELFQRGVAKQPPSPCAFAELDGDLKAVCSLVALPAGAEGPPGPPAPSGCLAGSDPASETVHSTVASSWVIVELLETKAWILTRTFDVVTGRLAKEKLLSTFASEQQQRQPSIGQWACQGWKGPTESRMYLCHLCILVATLMILAGVATLLLVILQSAWRAFVRSLLHLGNLCFIGCRRIPHSHTQSSSPRQSVEAPLTRPLSMLKLGGVAGTIVALGVAAAMYTFLDEFHMRI
ncbi:hypothetical protein Esti_006100 [Eimeria stiedai]